MPHIRVEFASPHGRLLICLDEFDPVFILSDRKPVGNMVWNNEISMTCNGKMFFEKINISRQPMGIFQNFLNFLIDLLELWKGPISWRGTSQRYLVV